MAIAVSVAGLLLSTAGCAVARTPWDDFRTHLRSLPHQGAVAAGRYGIYQGEYRVATDSFWVYATRAGGRVFHVERRGAHAEDPSARRTTWLEVDSAYRPLRGWEIRHQGAYRCAVTFTVRDTLLTATVFDGVPNRASQLRLRAPERFAVALSPAMAEGWAVMAALPSLRPIEVLQLGHCLTREDDGASGFLPRTVEQVEATRRPVAGRLTDLALVRLSGPTGLRRGTTTRRLLAWVDPRSGLLTQSITAARESATLELLWLAAP